MLQSIQIMICLSVVAAAVWHVAARLHIPPPILLVSAGIGLALVPGVPGVKLEPELVLLLVLPPIIYSSAVAMSWREFRFNLRPILLLAFGCVLFTTVAVAAATHLLLGLSWPIGFVLGAIVSPPDAMAPLSIARKMRLPRRIVAILGGEGLANDATALVLYRFAVAAVSAGAFSLPAAAGTFVAIVIGELLWGWVVAWSMLRLRKWVDDPRFEIALSFITPYLAYWPITHLGGSGVIATVVAGLYISWNGPRFISAATRLQGVFFWNLVIYLVEGLVFLVTGLQARTLLESIGDYSLYELAASAAVVSIVVILARFAWTFPAVYVPRLFSPALARRDPAPPWQWAFFLAFTGVRGIVSLAAALAIPLTMANGTPFPQRDIIFFLTFTVIVVTLVLQGLILQPVMSALGLSRTGDDEHLAEWAEEHEARKQAISAALERLEELRIARALPDAAIEPVRIRHRHHLSHIGQRSDDDDDHTRLANLHDDIELLLIRRQRETIDALFRSGQLAEDGRRRIERELDLREADFANLRAED